MIINLVAKWSIISVNECIKNPLSWDDGTDSAKPHNSQLTQQNLYKTLPLILYKCYTPL